MSKICIGMMIAVVAFLLSGCGGSGGSDSNSPHMTTIQGALKPGDQRFGTSGAYVVFYACHARATGAATVTMHGDTYPPLVEVGTMQPDGSILEYDNFEGGADNSTNPTGATATIGVTGGFTYYIAATTLTDTTAGPLPTGNYTLVFSDIFDSIQQVNNIQTNVRRATRRTP